MSISPMRRAFALPALPAWSGREWFVACMATLTITLTLVASAVSSSAWGFAVGRQFVVAYSVPVILTYLAWPRIVWAVEWARYAVQRQRGWITDAEAASFDAETARAYPMPTASPTPSSAHAASPAYAGAASMLAISPIPFVFAADGARDRAATILRAPQPPLPSDGDHLMTKGAIGAYLDLIAYGHAGVPAPEGTIATARVDLLERGIRVCAAVVGTKIPAALSTSDDQFRFLILTYLCQWYDAGSPLEVEARAAADGVDFNDLVVRIEAFLSGYRWAPATTSAAPRVCVLPALTRISTAHRRTSPFPDSQ
jgi:hypothetical protein